MLADRTIDILTDEVGFKSMADEKGHGRHD